MVKRTVITDTMYAARHLPKRQRRSSIVHTNRTSLCSSSLRCWLWLPFASDYGCLWEDEYDSHQSYQTTGGDLL